MQDDRETHVGTDLGRGIEQSLAEQTRADQSTAEQSGGEEKQRRGRNTKIMLPQHGGWEITKTYEKQTKEL